MTALPILPHEAEGAIANWAARMQLMVQEAESLSVWAIDALTEANRAADEPLLIQGTTTDGNGAIVVVPWTAVQLAKILEQFTVAKDFNTFMRAGGANAPITRLQKIGRPMWGGGGGR